MFDFCFYKTRKILPFFVTSPPPRNSSFDLYEITPPPHFYAPSNFFNPHISSPSMTLDIYQAKKYFTQWRKRLRLSNKNISPWATSKLRQSLDTGAHFTRIITDGNRSRIHNHCEAPELKEMEWYFIYFFRCQKQKYKLWK